MSSPFDRLSVDHLSLITQRLPAQDIGRLWLTGNRRLITLLTTGGVQEFFYFLWTPLLSQLEVPRLVSHFLTLRKFTFSSEKALLGPLKLEILPKTLKSLELSFPSWGQLMEPYLASVNPQGCLKVLFPELESLELGEWRDDGEVDWSKWHNTLPPTLTSLQHENSPISPQIIKELPNLRKLSGYYDSMNLELESFEMPNSLTSLVLRQGSPFVNLDNILSIRSLTYLLLEINVDDPYMRNVAGGRDISLPPSLVHLRLDIRIHLLRLPTLPSTLTMLSLVHQPYWCPEDLMMVHLPLLKTLSLSRGSSTFTTFMTTKKKEEFLAWLPRSLTVLSVDLLSQDAPLTSDHLKLLPSGIETFSSELSEDADVSCLPERLQTFYQWRGRFSLDDRNAFRLPPMLRSLNVPLDNLTLDSIQHLLSNPLLVSIEAIPVRLFPQETPTFASWRPIRNLKTRIIRIPIHLQHVSLRNPDQNDIVITFEHEGSTKPGSSHSLQSFQNYPRDGRMPKLTIQGLLPNTLRQFDVFHSLDANVLFLFCHCSQLETLSINSLSSPLKDAHLESLPKRLKILELFGTPTSEVTLQGVRSLSRTIQFLHLPRCPSILFTNDLSTDASELLREALPPFVVLDEQDVFAAR